MSVSPYCKLNMSCSVWWCVGKPRRIQGSASQVGGVSAETARHMCTPWNCNACLLQAMAELFRAEHGSAPTGGTQLPPPIKEIAHSRMMRCNRVYIVTATNSKRGHCFKGKRSGSGIGQMFCWGKFGVLTIDSQMFPVILSFFQVNCLKLITIYLTNGVFKVMLHPSAWVVFVFVFF